jgi:predicted HAD superfamily Cof-like phosphohydrolase
MHSQILVREFHAAFGHPVGTGPGMITGALAELRVRLIAEELAEYAASLGVQLHVDVVPNAVSVANAQMIVSCQHHPEAATSVVEAADALGDLDYVVQGANVVHGFPGASVVMEVHRSNMSKLGEDGKPIYREDGKILKGPNYFKPDIAHVLSVAEHGPIGEVAHHTV